VLRLELVALEASVGKEDAEAVPETCPAGLKRVRSFNKGVILLIKPNM
jgi:hypothetical protein